MVKLSLLQLTSSLSNKLYSVHRRALSVIYPPLPIRTPLVRAKLQPCSEGESSLVIITEEESVVLEIHTKVTQY